MWFAGHSLYPVLELKFHPTRKWRFDFAWPDHKLALEVDGGLWIPGGGGHNSAKGYIKDAEKRNQAAVHGWRLIRCTPAKLMTQATLDLVREALNYRCTCSG